MNDSEYDLAIIGAGAIGVSCAMWARMGGLNVLLLDEDEPGAGCSYGNACTIATHACVPVNNPGLLRTLPSMLFSKNSPLSFNWLYAIGNISWNIAFLRNCTRKRASQITDDLGNLLSYTDSGLDPLIKAAGAEDLVVDNKCINIYSTEKYFDASAPGIAGQRRNGVKFEIFEEGAIRELEPGLKLPIHRGILYTGPRLIRDPRELVRRFHASFVANGGIWLQMKVLRIVANNNDVIVKLADGTEKRARKVVVAADAHSKSIAGSGVSDLPLDTERGYHVMFRDHGHLLTRSVGWSEGGLYSSPMAHGLRLAGMVEIAGLKKASTPHCVSYMTRRAHEMFGEIGPPTEDWLGFRPTMPDSLPVIGNSHLTDKIMYAFGHQDRVARIQ